MKTRARRRAKWSYKPEHDVESLVKKAVNRLAQKLHQKNKTGLRSQIINEALRAHLAALAGKREGNVA
jgi:hypothetical protein